MAMNGNSIVEVKNVSFSFFEGPVLSNLSLSIPRNKVSVVMGPSGCGKSTLLSIIGGMKSPMSGSVYFEGEPVLPHDKKKIFRQRLNIGMLFQNNALLSGLNVFDNVAFPLREQTTLTEDIIKIVVLMKLEIVGLRGTAAMMTSDLSGGMTRRVAIARAIALDPSFIMYDEPFVGLDPIAMGIILKLIRTLNDISDTTSLVVTHDIKEGLSIADHVFLLDQGKVIVSGSQEEVTQTTNPKAQQFFRGEPDGPVRFHYPTTNTYAESISRGIV